MGRFRGILAEFFLIHILFWGAIVIFQALRSYEVRQKCLICPLKQAIFSHFAPFLSQAL